MPSIRRSASSVLLVTVCLAGCSPVSLGTSGSSAGSSPAPGGSGAAAQGDGSVRAIAVGAGPQKHYTVQ